MFCYIFQNIGDGNGCARSALVWSNSQNKMQLITQHVNFLILVSVDSVRDRGAASVHLLVASTAHVRDRPDAGIPALRPVRQGRPRDDSLAVASGNRCVPQTVQ